MRFVALIKDPTRIWTDYVVADLKREVIICTCSNHVDAETISKVLNMHQPPIPDSGFRIAENSEVVQ